MAIVHISVGVLFIIAGFLITKFPNVVSGYNSMQGESKKDIDIPGMVMYLRNGLIIMGAAIIAIFFILQSTKYAHFAYFSIMFIVIVGAIILNTGSQKFDKNNPKYKGK